ncbi:MAG: beta-lactamase family protein [Bacteroidota bacterium]|nr:beta-lactamase family protein [Bacteroidota bacterium]
MPIKLRLLLVLLTFSFGVSAQTFNAARLDSFLTLLEENNKMMGSLTITKAGRQEFSKAYGYSSINDRTASDPETKYRIGSISKMFTSVMIFQLIEEGKLTLATKLSDFFSEIPNANQITISRLLNHQSGLYNFTNDSTYLEWNTRKRGRQEILELIKGYEPSFKPGKKSEYSNTNYVLLGYIIEEITGKTYTEELKSRITDKIGLKNTFVGSTIAHESGDALSFNFIGKNWEPESETDMSIPGGAGAIISTPGDLTTFIEALFTSGKLLNEESLSQMTVIKDGYGYGIFKFPFYKHFSYGHTGGIDGFNSMVAYFPDDSVAVAFTGNGMNYPMNDIVLNALRIYYDMPFTMPVFTAYSISPQDLIKYEGIYSSSGFPLKITIKSEEDILTAQATGQPSFPLDAVSDTEFKFDPAGVVLIFIRAPDGNINEVTLQQRGRSFLLKKE